VTQDERKQVLEQKTRFAAGAPPPAFIGIHRFITRCQRLKYDEEPDYSALADDIRTMSFDQSTFDKLFDQSLALFHNRLAAKLYSQSAPEAYANMTQRILAR